MSALAQPLQLLPVDDDTGRRLRARRVRMGMSVRQLAAEADVDRGRLAKLEAGDLSVRDTTIGKVDAALSRLEQEMGMNDEPNGNGNGSNEVEFRVTGNFGVDVVVKGPVENLDALEASVSRLVARMQRETEESPESP